MLEIEFKNDNETCWVDFRDVESLKYLLDCGWQMTNWRI